MTKSIMIVGVGGQGSLLASKLLGKLLMNENDDVKVSEVKTGGKLIVNTQEIDPMPVIIGAAQYPNDILDTITSLGADVDAIDALTLANKAGSAKAVNIVLMGRLAKYFDIPYEKWITAIEQSVKPQFVEMNKKAFELGYNY